MVSSAQNVPSSERVIRPIPPRARTFADRVQARLERRDDLDETDRRVRACLERANFIVNGTEIGRRLWQANELIGYTDLVGKAFEALFYEP